MANDSPVRPVETYWTREVLNPRGRPVTPTDPEWMLYSSVITSTSPETDKGDRGRRGIGDYDWVDKMQSPGSHSLTVEYELERFPVDVAGDPVDPVADAAIRTADGRVGATHSLLQTVHAHLRPENTTHTKFFAREDAPAHPAGSVPDATARDSRKDHYARGGRAEEVALGIDASDNALVTVEFPYMFDGYREYEFDQPEDDGSYLHVVSTAAADTDVDVTIESVDAGTSETLTTDSSDATTPVASTASVPDLGRVWVDADHDGQILVFDDDGSGSGSAGEPAQLLAVIKGRSRYDGIDYDSGVPPLGEGSFDDGSSLDGKQYAIGAQVLWGSQPIADYHQGTSLTISNDVGEQEATDLGLEMAHQDGTREITAETTAFGETNSIDHFRDFVENREGEYVIQLTNGDITLPRAFISERGDQAREEGDAFILPSSTFMALADEANGRPAIEFSHA